ncbi:MULTISPECIES: non-hydrolyzing UDP-N-acetylglucosamine 2-epimerase [Pseudomonas]|uniref:UDP-N-acetylglucosamine 2-epimerase n=1 Tax=Pseudomonas fluorescens TaxID=294 RepID=A0AAE2A5M0_PSEFL|nr:MULTISPECIES: UDP-N-acetylglucosamine 2-epimerase (non-hydrolyzing) [Pseudomonas]KIF58350.1 UDP-N-acetylglucosamine 2-epimerase [Pseudomonas fluorescens]MBP3997348.1 UDP-N-acetylglucosamine 2-epimerase (non-hydrolyzing) [Pseudomonas koreensis]QIA04648.1 UDP-N-acetylglucosamine 2-epimerase (non-hydrolyzing) [Pseudomonas fluorescens]TFA86718.1 UDP-N-acetylglucosamine 2-epimerase (non-hydrolysing) [Pseudomonas sp. LAIL14HWK12:I2]SCZ18782.1 UDP-N-acetylglucosamine 2-epimerase (non-hydrolysing) 
MLKVMTIVGTRPELIKMSRVIAEFDEHTKHILVHTGQNFDYELNEVFFEEMGIRKPDHFLGAVGANAAQTIARVIEKADEVLEAEKPDALMLYGDTNSCLAVIAAKRRKIPVFHMEAGNRCFDQRVPEELNRKVLDHLSDINLVLTEHARRYLLDEGIPPDRIIKSGSHMEEVLNHFMPQIEASPILDELGLKSKQFFVVSTHREENVDTPANLQDLLDTLKALVETYDMPVIVSTHPRTRQRLEALGLDGLDSRIRFLKPFGFFAYIKLQKEAFCILSDSGTITEEASLLGLTAVTIRNAHERPEGMDQGTLIMSGLKSERVLDAVRIVTSQDQAGAVRRVVPDYEGGLVSQKVLRIVLSYTDFINRTVWSK